MVSITLHLAILNVILATFVGFGEAAGLTTVSIGANQQWLLNGQLVAKGSRAEGLLLNARLIQVGTSSDCDRLSQP